MELGALRKITALAATEVAAGLELSEKAAAALKPGLRPGEYLGILIDAGLWPDAIRFLAFALPRREGVWWACLAARGSLGPDAPPGQEASIVAAEEWVYRPTDEARRNAFALAEKIGFDSPAAYAALGAYWSQGSLAPPGMPEVPPDPALSPTAVASAVLLAAVIREPHKAEAKYRALMTSGIDIANGGNGSGKKAV
jgi:hypothetical protein